MQVFVFIFVSLFIATGTWFAYRYKFFRHHQVRVGIFFGILAI